MFKLLKTFLNNIKNDEADYTKKDTLKDTLYENVESDYTKTDSLGIPKRITDNIDYNINDSDNTKVLSENRNNTNVLFTPSVKSGKKSSSNKKVSAGRKKKTIKFNPDSPGGKLAQLFLNKLEEHDPEIITPDLGKWQACFNKMIFVEHYREEDIKDVILYCQQDDFWYSIIVNPFALKAKFPTLKMQMLRWIKKRNIKKEKEDVFEQAKKDFNAKRNR